MNIKDTLTSIELKLGELDAMESEYEEAEQCGNEVGMKSIVKSEEKLASSLEALVVEMDTSDISEVYAELEQERMRSMTDALREKVSKLSGFIKEYDKASEDGNQLEVYKLMKKIKRIGKEISHIEMNAEEL